MKDIDLAIKNNDFSNYTKAYKKILISIFYPSLFYPKLISEDERCCLFLLINEAKKGFFFDFSVYNIISELIVVNVIDPQHKLNKEHIYTTLRKVEECNSKIGLIFCKNPAEEKYLDRVKEISKDQGLYIFLISRNDLMEMIKEFSTIGEQTFDVLRSMFKTYPGKV
ncbi:hypothetical protein [Klebsiella pneumoniae]|uniref:hypothetical protein n=1 Tax=Klebsiella pneumoniae TaxID=573 RepID=UPI001EFA5C22|nr:hypothetical protein [Klebsiella pneumoniae]